MRILVLGGTGAVGRLLLDELLAASHTVVIYARSPQKLPENISSNPHATVIKGELTNSDLVEQALDGVDAVVSSIGPPEFGHPPGVPLAKAYGLLISLMQKRGVKRLIALGTPSMPDPNDKSSLLWWLIITLIATVARNSYKDVVAIGETIRASRGIDWTIVRVPILTNAKKREYVTGYVGDGKTGFTLPRIAFAAFVVDELERNNWKNKAPLLTTS